MGPKEYLERLEKLNLEKYDSVKLTSLSEAKQMLAKIKTDEDMLRQTKREINLELKTIRNEYRNKIADAGTGGAAMFSLFGKRKAGSSYKASQKRAVQNERDKMIAPYEKIKTVIDQELIILDDLKLQITNAIEEFKSEQQ